MKKLTNIFLSLICLICFQVAYASPFSNGSQNNQNQEQEGRRKAEPNVVRPDGDYKSNAEIPDYEYSGSEQTAVTSERDRDETLNPKPAATEKSVKEDDSVSKYNFIFYFLYKFKYDSEETP